ncbi:MAG: ClpXP protease specificity-enhancing factor SspB [Pseudomonadota bacterium]
MTKMTDENTLRYDRMVEEALRGVVRQAVEEVIDNGLPGDHHFYITFVTDYPGVKIPDYLRDRYPGEMTIVLQYQFSNLHVDKERLEVTLSFNNQPENLVVPLNAISIFADPSVNFALQFQPLGGDMDDEDIDDGSPDDHPPSGGKKPRADSGKSGEVVSLDQFRKKK